MIFLYLDPSTGSLVIQFLVGTFALILFYFKQFKQFVKSFFNSDKTEEIEENNGY